MKNKSEKPTKDVKPLFPANVRRRGSQAWAKIGERWFKGRILYKYKNTFGFSPNTKKENYEIESKNIIAA